MGQPFVVEEVAAWVRGEVLKCRELSFAQLLLVREAIALGPKWL
jgi:hypothetical protein